MKKARLWFFVKCLLKNPLHIKQIQRNDVNLQTLPITNISDYYKRLYCRYSLIYIHFTSSNAKVKQTL